jgi:hypothetical protein
MYQRIERIKPRLRLVCAVQIERIKPRLRLVCAVQIEQIKPSLRLVCALRFRLTPLYPLIIKGLFYGPTLVKSNTRSLR